MSDSSLHSLHVFSIESKIKADQACCFYCVTKLVIFVMFPINVLHGHYFYPIPYALMGIVGRKYIYLFQGDKNKLRFSRITLTWRNIRSIIAAFSGHSGPPIPFLEDPQFPRSFTFIPISMCLSICQMS